jgi:chemotaxis signal transduction protein
VSVPPGDEHLLVICAGMPCAVALSRLREVLPALPATTALPFSPPWLLGIFPLRTELVALVDPTPVLCDAPPSGAGTNLGPLAAVLVAGEGEQSLGMAVAAVGDIAVIQPEEIVRDPSGLGGGVRSVYVGGWYAPAGGRPAVILDLPRLVTDLLRELAEESVDG